MTGEELVALWGEDRLEGLFELIDAVPMFLNVVEGPEFQVIVENRQVRESPSGSTIGKKLSDFYPGTTPLRQALERVYATGKAETLHDLPSYFPGTQYADRYFTRSFVRIGDGPAGAKRILVTTYEVTEAVAARHREQREQQRLFALLEEIPTLISVLEGPELRLVMMNRRTRELSGDLALGTSLHAMVKPQNPILLTAAAVYATGIPESLEVTARDITDLSGRSFAVTMVPIREHDGTITRIMSSAIEITEHLRAAQAKDQFLAMLGHELRNPLAPMSTAVQVMRLEGASSPALEILERQIKHMTRLVDDLLDISRITRGVVTLDRTDLEIATVVNRALEMASPLLEQRGHRVVTDLVHRGLGVSGDSDRLAQVVANLITNAAKYSEPGSEIRIVAAREGDRVKLHVADAGVGIARGMLARVFEAFVQQPQTLDRSRGGLGLGLAIVKSLVEAHGGTVCALSEGLGRGSTFVVELPHIKFTRTPPTPMPFVRPTAPTGPAVRVLVVDDNRDAVDVLRIALEARGHSVAYAYDGPTALEVATTHAPQIALIDIGLPVMDGYRLAELLHAAYAIPVVAITGYGQETDHQRSVEAGFAAHLVKPVDFGELAALIEQLATSSPSSTRPAP